MWSPEAKDEVALSVVIPAYNDAALLARHLPALEAYLRELDLGYEIVISDDGSDDDGATRDVAEELGTVYIRSPANRGKGSALRRGMRCAQGRLRIFTDADVPYELDAIGTMVRHLDLEGFDFVTGDRTLESSHYSALVPLWRRIGSWLFSAIVRRVGAFGRFDTQCGLKGFRADVAEDLFGVGRIDRFAIDVELFAVALARNYKIARLPVRLRCQEGSSVRFLSDGGAMLWDLLRIRWYSLVGCYRSRRPRPS